MISQPLVAAARVWYSRMLLAAPSTASPRDSPLTRAGVGPADRVLLVGNGVVHGWGVSLRGMAVPGHLATLLHARTGRAVIVDLVGEERMNAASALAWLGDAASRGHDLAVVAVGLNDALRLTPLPAWERRMSDLVDRIREAQEPGAAVLLIGLPHVRAFAMADSAMGSVAQHHADRMDGVLREIAAKRPDVSFVAAPQERFEPDRALGSSGMYRAWAEQLLPAILPVLERVRAVKPVAPVREARWGWAGTAAALASDGSEAQVRLDSLTEVVRERFGVAMAGVHVVDDGQVWSIGGRSGGPRQMPRSLAYCDRTVESDAPTVIQDASRDPAFADSPFLDVVGLPFYAGVPLHALDGRAVGTLCVLDGEPRTDIDPTDLQQFVGEAEAALRSFEIGEPRGSASTTAPSKASARETRTPGAADSMSARLLAGALRPVLHGVLSEFLRRQARPHWDNRAVTTGDGRRPLRVLVFGAGFAVGYGSDGADDPLPVQLSAALTAASGRGSIVEVRARPSTPLEHTLDLLGAAGAAGFDHVVWCPTLEEATRAAGRRWNTELRRIIAAVRASGPPQLRMTLLGLPLVEGGSVLQRAGRVLGRGVNQRIARAAREDERAEFLPLPGRALTEWNSPMFDPTYRSLVAALIVQRVLEPEPPLGDTAERVEAEPAVR